MSSLGAAAIAGLAAAAALTGAVMHDMACVSFGCDPWIPAVGNAIVDGGEAAIDAVATATTTVAHSITSGCSWLYKKVKSAPPKPPTLDGTGKVHGDIPSHVPKKWTNDTLEELAADLETSIGTRKAEQARLGEDDPHRDRIREEEKLLVQIIKKLSGS